MKRIIVLVCSALLISGVFPDNNVFSKKNATIATPTIKAMSANCQSPTSYIILYNLPAKGTWTIKQLPNDTTIEGEGPNFALVNVPKGNYRFIVTDSAGVSSDTTKIVVIEPSTTPPATPVIGKVIQPTQKEPTATITVNGLPSAKEGPWTLYISPGNLNFSGNDTTATIYGLNYGDYSFVVENSSFCLSQPAKVTIKRPEIPSGLEVDSKYNEDIRLFPNPATDQITIERNSNAGIKNQYKVIDQLGVVVSSGMVESQLTIGLSHVTNGVYFFQLENGTTIKFVKK